MKLLYWRASRATSSAWSAGPSPAAKSSASMRASASSSGVVIASAEYSICWRVSSSFGSGSLGSESWKCMVGMRERCSRAVAEDADEESARRKGSMVGTCLARCSPSEAALTGDRSDSLSSGSA